LPLEEVVVRLRLGLHDQAPDVIPEARVGDRQLAYLLGLGEHGQAFPVVVEVPELDGLQRSFAEAVGH
jgi:hypothetical protein